MEAKNRFVTVKASKVKYDPEFAEGAERLPKTLTVLANTDFIECALAVDDFLDDDDATEYIGELIEEKIGVPVISFEWCFK